MPRPHASVHRQLDFTFPIPAGTKFKSPTSPDRLGRARGTGAPRGLSGVLFGGVALTANHFEVTFSANSTRPPAHSKCSVGVVGSRSGRYGDRRYERESAVFYVLPRSFEPAHACLNWWTFLRGAAAPIWSSRAVWAVRRVMPSSARIYPHGRRDLRRRRRSKTINRPYSVLDPPSGV